MCVPKLANQKGLFHPIKMKKRQKNAPFSKKKGKIAKGGTKSCAIFKSGCPFQKWVLAIPKVVTDKL
jgi:hypothetical protein